MPYTLPMTLRLAAAAVLGAVLLTGCSGPAVPAPAPSSTVTDTTVASTCEAMRNGVGVADYAARLVPGLYPDKDTAVYEVRKRIRAGCPQYATRP